MDGRKNRHPPPSRRRNANGGDANGDHDDDGDYPKRSRSPCDQPSDDDDDDDDDDNDGGEGSGGVVRHRHLRRRPSDDERRRPHQQQHRQRQWPREVTSGYRWWRGCDREREKFIPLLLILVVVVVVVVAALLWFFLPSGASLPDVEEKPKRLRSLPAVRAHFIKAKATSPISRPRQSTLKTKTRPPTPKPTHRFDCTKALIPQQRENNDDVDVRSSAANETLAVISVCIPGDRFDDEYIDASFSNKMLFCDKWGAECILSRERLHPETPKQYSPKWEKLFYITKAMYTTNADWLMWLDCDAAFTNFDLDWRVHLDGYLDRSKVLVASRDVSGINLGVFLVPNTPYSRFFMEMMAEERYEIERRALSHKDQNALKNLLAKSPQLGCSVDDSVPQDKINSVGSFRTEHCNLFFPFWN